MLFSRILFPLPPTTLQGCNALFVGSRVAHALATKARRCALTPPRRECIRCWSNSLWPRSPSSTPTPTPAASTAPPSDPPQSDTDSLLAFKFITAPRNQEIAAPSVFVVGPGDARPGIMSVPDALAKIDLNCFDLVMVNSTATMPVCRVLPKLSPKTLYEMSRRKRPETSADPYSSSKPVNHSKTTKEIEIKAGISWHDLEVKARKVNQLLGKGYKVQISVIESGRQKGEGSVTLSKIMDLIDKSGTSRGVPAKTSGSTVSVLLQPPTQPPKNKP